MRYYSLLPVLAVVTTFPATTLILRAAEPSSASQATWPAPRLQANPGYGRPPFDTRFAKDAEFWMSLRWSGLPELPSPDKILEEFPQYAGSEELRKLLQPGVGLGLFEATFRVGPPDHTDYEVVLAGPTIEQTKQLGQAVLALYAGWWQDHGQQFIAQHIQDLQGQITALNDSIKDADERYRADLTVLGGSALTPQTANDLRTRQLLLEVDLAGVQTKIYTAQKLLRGEAGTGTHTNTWREQLEVITTSSQIEQAGVMAQRDKIATMLKADQRIEDRNLQKLVDRKNQTQTIIGILEKAQASPPAQPFETQPQIAIWRVQPEPTPGLPLPHQRMPFPLPPGAPVPPIPVPGQPPLPPPGEGHPSPADGPKNPPPPQTDRGHRPPPPGADGERHAPIGPGHQPDRRPDQPPPGPDLRPEMPPPAGQPDQPPPGEPDR